MSSKKYWIGPFAFLSVLSCGIGIADAGEELFCSIDQRAQYEEVVCPDRIEWDAEDWFFGGLAGIATLAGVSNYSNIVSAFQGGAPTYPGQPSNPSPNPADRGGFGGSGRGKREIQLDDD
ncbi:hypothetical protein [Pontixanthobacter sp. CEM42]|uniref:hypothetical protein n=1 Tax=Pontixanthobacter sp. CEM42 TaxID=2792077 RepID=UPI001ADECBE2|nr:hypothetical protein [Pontixanthobacter sp. CEM42]